MEMISPGAIGPRMKLAACATSATENEGAGAARGRTTSVTRTVCGLPVAPAASMVSVLLYSPGTRFAVFTPTVTVTGVLAATVPDDGAMVSQDGLPAIV